MMKINNKKIFFLKNKKSEYFLVTQVLSFFKKNVDSKAEFRFKIVYIRKILIEKKINSFF